MACIRQFVLVALWVATCVSAPPATAAGIRLRHLWTHDAGGAGRAEIVAFDAAAKELLVVNGTDRCVTRLAVTGREVGRLDVSSLGDPTSVAASHGLIAVAVAAPSKTDAGHVALFRSVARRSESALPAQPVAAVRVGALPDMVTFTPDGRYALVACEGEPSDDYSIDPEGSIGVIDVGRGPENAIALSADFVRFNSERESLERNGVRLAGPSSQSADGRAALAEDVEPEYIAIAAGGRTAWATLQENNAIAVIDIPGARVERIVGLGYKDHSRSGAGLDVSNNDGVNIRSHSVFGMYQPDSIAAFEADGKTYLATANEGDSRRYAGFSDEALLEDLRLDLSLRVGEGLSQLKVSRVGGDTDKDGDVDRLLTFGARSLSIWDADGRLIYDSGDALEQLIATKLPERFNIDSDGLGTIDARSGDKGPEPEAVVVGRIGDSVYAFVGLERTSAIAVFDVTRPAASRLIDIVPFPLSKDRTGGPCIAPEGLCFVPADRSPSGVPSLAVACEVTGTTMLYEIDSVSAE